MDRNQIIDDLHKGLKDGHIIPLICEDAFVYRDDTGTIISLQSYIWREVKKKCNNYDEGDCKKARDVIENSEENYYRFNLIRQYYEHNKKHGENHSFPTLFHKLIAIDENKVTKGIDLKEDVKKFLNAYDFKYIFTTSCFQILESVALRDKRFKPFWNGIVGSNTQKN